MKQQKNDIENVEIKKYEIFQLLKKDDVIKICIGNNLIIDKSFKTFEEAIKFIKSKPYELIINTCCFVYDFAQQQKKSE